MCVPTYLVGARTNPLFPPYNASQATAKEGRMVCLSLLFTVSLQFILGTEEGGGKREKKKERGKSKRPSGSLLGPAVEEEREKEKREGEWETKATLSQE